MIANITDLKEEARVKYIGDIMTRPKKRAYGHFKAII